MFTRFDVCLTNLKICCKISDQPICWKEKVRPRWWFIALSSCSDHALSMSRLMAIAHRMAKEELVLTIFSFHINDGLVFGLCPIGVRNCPSCNFPTHWDMCKTKRSTKKVPTKARVALPGVFLATVEFGNHKKMVIKANQIDETTEIPCSKIHKLKFSTATDVKCEQTSTSEVQPDVYCRGYELELQNPLQGFNSQLSMDEIGGMSFPKRRPGIFHLVLLLFVARGVFFVFCFFFCVPFQQKAESFEPC